MTRLWWSASAIPSLVWPNWPPISIALPVVDLWSALSLTAANADLKLCICWWISRQLHWSSIHIWNCGCVIILTLTFDRHNSTTKGSTRHRNYTLVRSFLLHDDNGQLFKICPKSSLFFTIFQRCSSRRSPNISYPQPNSQWDTGPRSEDILQFQVHIR